MNSKILSKPTIATFLLLGLCWNVDMALCRNYRETWLQPCLNQPENPVPRKPFCELGKDAITLANTTLRCVFSTY